MVMYGAETDELERIAAELVSVADELDAGATGLTSAVSTVAWLGEAAIGYLADWTSLKIPRLNLTTHFLRDAAVELRHQAREQRLASDRCGTTYVKDPGWNTRETIAAKLDQELAFVRRLSPDAQRAWWESLTDAQREALIRNRSEDVFVLDGLPESVRDAARAAWEAEVVPGMVVVSETKLSATVTAKLRLAHLLGGGAVTMTRFADGSIDLTVGASAGVGLGDDDAGASVTGNASMRLHFESQDEFDEFTHDLIVSETSNPLVRRYRRALLLAEHGSSVETVGLGVKVPAALGTADGSLSGDLSVNLPDRTLTGTVTGSVAGDDIGDMRLSGAVTVGPNGLPRTATVTASGSATVLAKSIAQIVGQSPLPVSGDVAGTGSVTFELDLTDPEVQTFVPAVVLAAGRGDPVEMFNQVALLGDRVSVQAVVGSQIEGGLDIDANVAGVELEGRHRRPGVVWIRPPSGDFVEVYSDGGSASGSAPAFLLPSRAWSEQ